MNKENDLKRLNEESKNSVQSVELGNLINNLCKNRLSLITAMKKYVEHIPGQEDMKIEILTVISKYEDIFREFCDFLLTGKIIKNENSVCEKGYTAYDILDKEPCLLTHTAFVWLVYLRDNIDKTDNVLDTLKNGLPVNNGIKLSYNVGKIRDYLSKNENITDEVVKQLVKPYYEHPDIANEFEYWIRKKQFVEENPIIECGYTAERLYEEYKDILDIQGIFSLMITLKDDSEKALRWINEGFPRK